MSAGDSCIGVGKHDECPRGEVARADGARPNAGSAEPDYATGVGCAWACLETHLPNAFFLFSLVPYLAKNAAWVAAVVPRSWAQAFAASVRASAICCSLAPAFWDTHLPNAFFLFLLVPYLAANAAWVSGVVPCSVRQAADASSRACSPAFCRAAACLDTHLPKAFFLF